MLMNKKIKEIIKEMILKKEFEKIINFKGYSYFERRKVKNFYNKIKDLDIDKIPILPLIMSLPKEVMRNILCMLLPYTVKEK